MSTNRLLYKKPDKSIGVGTNRISCGIGSFLESTVINDLNLSNIVINNKEDAVSTSTGGFKLKTLQVNNDIDILNNVNILGNCNIYGHIESINTSNIEIEDRNIILASSNTDDIGIDNSGLHIKYNKEREVINVKTMNDNSKTFDIDYIYENNELNDLITDNFEEDSDNTGWYKEKAGRSLWTNTLTDFSNDWRIWRIKNYASSNYLSIIPYNNSSVQNIDGYSGETYSMSSILQNNFDTIILIEDLKYKFETSISNVNEPISINHIEYENVRIWKYKVESNVLTVIPYNSEESDGSTVESGFNSTYTKINQVGVGTSFSTDTFDSLENKAISSSSDVNISGLNDDQGSIINKTFKAFTVSINSDIQTTLNSHFTRDTNNDLIVGGEMVYTWGEKHSSVFATLISVSIPGIEFNSLDINSLQSVSSGNLTFGYNSGTFPLEQSSDGGHQPISSFPPTGDNVRLKEIKLYPGGIGSGSTEPTVLTNPNPNSLTYTVSSQTTGSYGYYETQAPGGNRAILLTYDMAYIDLSQRTITGNSFDSETKYHSIEFVYHTYTSEEINIPDPAELWFKEENSALWFEMEKTVPYPYKSFRINYDTSYSDDMSNMLSYFNTDSFNSGWYKEKLSGPYVNIKTENKNVILNSIWWSAWRIKNDPSSKFLTIIPYDSYINNDDSTTTIPQNISGGPGREANMFTDNDDTYSITVKSGTGTNPNSEYNSNYSPNDLSIYSLNTLDLLIDSIYEYNNLWWKVWRIKMNTETKRITIIPYLYNLNESITSNDSIPSINKLIHYQNIMGTYDLKDNIGNTITRSDIYRAGSGVFYDSFGRSPGDENNYSTIVKVGVGTTLNDIENELQSYSELDLYKSIRNAVPGPSYTPNHIVTSISYFKDYWWRIWRIKYDTDNSKLIVIPYPPNGVEYNEGTIKTGTINKNIEGDVGFKGEIADYLKDSNHLSGTSTDYFQYTGYDLTDNNYSSNFNNPKFTKNQIYYSIEVDLNIVYSDDPYIQVEEYNPDSSFYFRLTEGGNTFMDYTNWDRVVDALTSIYNNNSEATKWVKSIITHNSKTLFRFDNQEDLTGHMKISWFADVPSVGYTLISSVNVTEANNNSDNGIDYWYFDTTLKRLVRYQYTTTLTNNYKGFEINGIDENIKQNIFNNFEPDDNNQIIETSPLTYDLMEIKYFGSYGMIRGNRLLSMEIWLEKDHSYNTADILTKLGTDPKEIRLTDGSTFGGIYQYTSVELVSKYNVDWQVYSVDRSTPEGAILRESYDVFKLTLDVLDADDPTRTLMASTNNPDKNWFTKYVATGETGYSPHRNNYPIYSESDLLSSDSLSFGSYTDNILIPKNTLYVEIGPPQGGNITYLPDWYKEKTDSGLWINTKKIVHRDYNSFSIDYSGGNEQFIEDNLLNMFDEDIGFDSSNTNTGWYKEKFDENDNPTTGMWINTYRIDTSIHRGFMLRYDNNDKMEELINSKFEDDEYVKHNLNQGWKQEKVDQRLWINTFKDGNNSYIWRVWRIYNDILNKKLNLVPYTDIRSVYNPTPVERDIESGNSTANLENLERLFPSIKLSGHDTVTYTTYLSGETLDYPICQPIFHSTTTFEETDPFNSSQDRTFGNWIPNIAHWKNIYQPSDFSGYTSTGAHINTRALFLSLNISDSNYKILAYRDVYDDDDGITTYVFTTGVYYALFHYNDSTKADPILISTTQYGTHAEGTIYENGEILYYKGWDLDDNTKIMNRDNYINERPTTHGSDYDRVLLWLPMTPGTYYGYSQNDSNLSIKFIVEYTFEFNTSLEAWILRNGASITCNVSSNSNKHIKTIIMVYKIVEKARVNIKTQGGSNKTYIIDLKTFDASTYFKYDDSKLHSSIGRSNILDHTLDTFENTGLHWDYINNENAYVPLSYFINGIYEDGTTSVSIPDIQNGTKLILGFRVDNIKGNEQYKKTINDKDYFQDFTSDKPTDSVTINGSSATNVWDGEKEINLHEVILYSSKLTDEEFSNTVKYLNKKWSIYETAEDGITPEESSGNYSSTAPSTLPVATNIISRLDGETLDEDPSKLLSVELMYNNNIEVTFYSKNDTEWIGIYEGHDRSQWEAPLPDRNSSKLWLYVGGGQNSNTLQPPKSKLIFDRNSMSAYNTSFPLEPKNYTVFLFKNEDVVDYYDITLNLKITEISSELHTKNLANNYKVTGYFGSGNTYNENKIPLNLEYKKIEYVNNTFSFTNDINLVNDSDSFFIGDTNVLSKDTLGVSVVNSSLTKVGTINQGTWNATPIGVDYGGLAGIGTTMQKGDILYISDSTPTFARLPIGNVGDALGINPVTSLPEWKPIQLESNNDDSIYVNNTDIIKKPIELGGYGLSEEWIFGGAPLSDTLEKDRNSVMEDGGWRDIVLETYHIYSMRVINSSYYRYHTLSVIIVFYNDPDLIDIVHNPDTKIIINGVEFTYNKPPESEPPYSFNIAQTYSITPNYVQHVAYSQEYQFTFYYSTEPYQPADFAELEVKLSNLVKEIYTNFRAYYNYLNDFNFRADNTQGIELNTEGDIGYMYNKDYLNISFTPVVPVKFTTAAYNTPNWDNNKEARSHLFTSDRTIEDYKPQKLYKHYNYLNNGLTVKFYENRNDLNTQDIATSGLSFKTTDDGDTLVSTLLTQNYIRENVKSWYLIGSDGSVTDENCWIDLEFNKKIILSKYDFSISTTNIFSETPNSIQIKLQYQKEDNSWVDIHTMSSTNTNSINSSEYYTFKNNNFIEFTEYLPNDPAISLYPESTSLTNYNVQQYASKKYRLLFTISSDTAVNLKVYWIRAKGFIFDRTVKDFAWDYYRDNSDWIIGGYNGIGASSWFSESVDYDTKSPEDIKSINLYTRSSLPFSNLNPSPQNDISGTLPGVGYQEHFNFSNNNLSLYFTGEIYNAVTRTGREDSYSKQNIAPLLIKDLTDVVGSGYIYMEFNKYIRLTQLEFVLDLVGDFNFKLYYNDNDTHNWIKIIEGDIIVTGNGKIFDFSAQMNTVNDINSLELEYMTNLIIDRNLKIDLTHSNEIFFKPSTAISDSKINYFTRQAKDAYKYKIEITKPNQNKMKSILMKGCISNMISIQNGIANTYIGKIEKTKVKFYNYINSKRYYLIKNSDNYDAIFRNWMDTTYSYNGNMIDNWKGNHVWTLELVSQNVNPTLSFLKNVYKIKNTELTTDDKTHIGNALKNQGARLDLNPYTPVATDLVNSNTGVTTDNSDRYIEVLGSWDNKLEVRIYAYINGALYYLMGGYDGNVSDNLNLNELDYDLNINVQDAYESPAWFPVSNELYLDRKSYSIWTMEYKLDSDSEIYNIPTMPPFSDNDIMYYCWKQNLQSENEIRGHVGYVQIISLYGGEIHSSGEKNHNLEKIGTDGNEGWICFNSSGHYGDYCYCINLDQASLPQIITIPGISTDYNSVYTIPSVFIYKITWNGHSWDIRNTITNTSILGKKVYGYENNNATYIINIEDNHSYNPQVSIIRYDNEGIINRDKMAYLSGLKGDSEERLNSDGSKTSIGQRMSYGHPLGYNYIDIIAGRANNNKPDFLQQFTFNFNVHFNADFEPNIMQPALKPAAVQPDLRQYMWEQNLQSENEVRGYIGYVNITAWGKLHKSTDDKPQIDKLYSVFSGASFVSAITSIPVLHTFHADKEDTFKQNSTIYNEIFKITYISGLGENAIYTINVLGSNKSLVGYGLNLDSSSSANWTDVTNNTNVKFNIIKRGNKWKINVADINENDSFIRNKPVINGIPVTYLESLGFSYIFAHTGGDLNNIDSNIGFIDEFNFDFIPSYVSIVDILNGVASTAYSGLNFNTMYSNTYDYPTGDLRYHMWKQNLQPITEKRGYVGYVTIKFDSWLVSSLSSHGNPQNYVAYHTLISSTSTSWMGNTVLHSYTDTEVPYIWKIEYIESENAYKITPKTQANATIQYGSKVTRNRLGLLSDEYGGAYDNNVDGNQVNNIFYHDALIIPEYISADKKYILRLKENRKIIRFANYSSSQVNSKYGFSYVENPDIHTWLSSEYPYNIIDKCTITFINPYTGIISSDDYSS